MTDSIRYQLEPDLSVEEFLSVLRDSTLSERRPVDDLETISGMLRHADVIATARNSAEKLVGVARSITDYHYCTYLSDLAVTLDHQRRGIGKQLIEFSHQSAGRHTTLILLAAPAAVSYYPRIGMEAHSSCWTRPPEPQS